jgi:hypothetical protein
MLAGVPQQRITGKSSTLPDGSSMSSRRRAAEREANPYTGREGRLYIVETEPSRSRDLQVSTLYWSCKAFARESSSLAPASNLCSGLRIDDEL